MCWVCAGGLCLVFVFSLVLGRKSKNEVLPKHSTRARTRRTTVGGGESSEGGRYRIWLLLGLVARHWRGSHSKLAR